MIPGCIRSLPKVNSFLPPLGERAGNRAGGGGEPGGGKERWGRDNGGVLMGVCVM